MIEDWRRDYNTHRPHSALGMMAPTEFADGYRAYEDASPPDCARPPGSLRPAATPLPFNQPPPTDSHSRRTDERGPARIRMRESRQMQSPHAAQRVAPVGRGGQELGA